MCKLEIINVHCTLDLKASGQKMHEVKIQHVDKLKIFIRLQVRGLWVYDTPQIILLIHKFSRSSHCLHEMKLFKSYQVSETENITICFRIS